KGFTSTLGGWALVGVFAIACLGLLAYVRNRVLVSDSLLNILFAFSKIIIPVVLVGISGAADYRRAYIGFSVILLTFTILALTPQLALPQLRLGLFAMLCALQYFVA